jgi:hypothetical protein
VNGWILPRAWRSGQCKWSPEAKQIALMIAREGLGSIRVAQRMQLLGIPVGPGTVDNWLHPRTRTGSAEA